MIYRWYGTRVQCHGTFDFCLLAGQVADGDEPVHALPGDERLLELAEEELQRARQHVHVVHRLQHSRIPVVHLVNHAKNKK